MHSAEIKLDLSNHIVNSNWRLGDFSAINHRSYKKCVGIGETVVGGERRKY